MVTINIGRREAIFFGAILMTFLVLGLAIAYGGNQPTVMGHSLGELEKCANGQTLVMSEGAWTCGSAGSGSSYKVGRYTGDGISNRIISGVGIYPKSVIIFPLYQEDSCDEWVIKTLDMETESPDTQGQQNQGILSLNDDGFTISNHCNVNQNGKLYSYMAWTW